MARYGPAGKAPNPLQRWASTRLVPSALLVTFLIVAPMIAVGAVLGDLSFNVGLGIAAAMFLLMLAISWVRAPYVPDPGTTIVPYLPWFNSKSTEDNDQP